MASAAVELAERIYPSIAERSVLFIGAGEMIELTAAHFAARHPRHLTFANRTGVRAGALAERYLGRTIALNDLPGELACHDIVISCTASPLPIVGKGLIESAMKARKHRPMLMFDLAVPRDIEAQVGGLDDVFLYTVDDLGNIARAGLDTRRNAVAQAEVIIENHVTDFMHWLGARELVPTIRALRDGAERSRRHALAQALKRLNRGEDPQLVLELLSQQLTNKFLHAPMHALNHAAEDDREAFVALLRRLHQMQRPE
jgi:glutamyl-tRNA reductase